MSCRRGMELRMYNERTRQTLACTRSVGGRMGCSMRDIPSLDLEEGDRARRRCDGTLRQETTAPQNQSCTRGACGKWGLEAHPLAMVYSPCQIWKDAYAPDTALERGTLFAELDLPFEPGSCRRGCM